jgi:SPP1 family predicted phage head-tail adaptor
MVSIGDLRHPVTVQQESQVADGAGGYTLSWTSLGTRYAAIETLAGREESFADGQEGRQLYRVTIRADLAVTTAMRLLYEGRILNIRGVQNINLRDRFFELVCEEGGAI